MQGPYIFHSQWSLAGTQELRYYSLYVRLRPCAGRLPYLQRRKRVPRGLAWPCLRLCLRVTAPCPCLRL